MQELLVGFGWAIAWTTGLVSVLFLVAIRLRRFDIIDVFWAILIALSATVAIFAIGNSVTWRSVIIMVIIYVWAVRLAAHVGRRFMSSKQQDARYTELIGRYQRSPVLNVFFRIYITQAILAVLVSGAAVSATISMSDTTWFIAGCVIAVVGICIEAIADRQLGEFLKQTSSRGKTMQSGLWQYSRHPNYFGELLVWWGLAITSIGTDWWAIGIVGSITITILIVGVSGIPLAEKAGARRADWEQYKRRTSILFILPPKK